MHRISPEYDVLDDVTPVAITSSTDATPIVITATSHGLSTGDLVLIYGHGTNVAANGIFKVTKVNDNSFSLQDINTGANVAGSGAGAGSNGHLMVAPKIISCEDFEHITLQLNTAGTSTLTLKFAGSAGKLRADASAQHGDTPNFGATVADDNPYNFIDFAHLDGGGAVVDGDTGVALAGADTNTIVELNVSGLKYVCPIVTAYTQGRITLKAKLFSNA